MAISGIGMLPPVITTDQALELYKSVARIKNKIGVLNSELQHSIVNSGLIQVFTLNESVQSTRIEGTQVTFADVIEEATKKKKSTEVKEVENYLLALQEGVQRIKKGDPISTRMIQELHKILMSGSRGTVSSSGQYRKIQNFIGPDNKIENAVYIPIPANEISSYMSNLEHYINSMHHSSFDNVKHENGYEIVDENYDVLIKASVLHAQFESIHPFLDGNGRMGRILIVLATMMDHLIDFPILFVSEELEKERIRYYNLLNGIRGNNPEWFEWIDFFLGACERTADFMLDKLSKIDSLVQMGLDKLRKANGLELTIKVWFSTFGRPNVVASDIADGLDISIVTARKHLNKLVELKLLDTDNFKKRNKTYVNYDLLRVLRT